MSVLGEAPTSDVELRPSGHALVSERPARLAPLANGVVFVVLATGMAVSAAFVVVPAFGSETIGFDFRGTLWDPAIAIRHGLPPYPDAVTSEVEVGNPALYPPLLMLLVVPLTLLSWSAGLAIWTVIQIGAVVGALAILRVRDARCYVIALLSLPVVAGLGWGNATLLLVPLAALAWRWRDSWPRGGLIVGLAIASKLFAWPLIVWLLATRRYRAAGLAVAATVAFVVAPWALIGFDGMTTYPDLLRVAESLYATHSFSVATVAAGLGVGAEQASLVALVVGLIVTGFAVVAGRRGADEVSMALVVLAAILGSPIVWEYYYALLLVPIAIMRPRFSVVWAAIGLVYVTRLLPRDTLELADLAPGGSGCCRPEEVPIESWLFNHSPPALWPALGQALLAAAVTFATIASWRRDGPRRGSRRSRVDGLQDGSRQRTSKAPTSSTFG